MSNALGLGICGRKAAPPPPSQHCACGAMRRFDSLCVGGRSLCPACHTRPPAFPFQRVMRVLHQQQQQTSCPCFRFLSPCSRMSSDTFWSDACRNSFNKLLQAQLNALYASCGATVRVTASVRRPPLPPLGACPAYVLRCGLPRLCVTRCCADCGVLCVRCGGREDAVSVVEDG